MRNLSELQDYCFELMRQCVKSNKNISLTTHIAVEQTNLSHFVDVYFLSDKPTWEHGEWTCTFGDIINRLTLQTIKLEFDVDWSECCFEL